MQVEAKRVLGGAECDRRVELPFAELRLDLDLAPSGRCQPGCKSLGTSAHLFRFGQPLLGQPSPVALL